MQKTNDERRWHIAVCKTGNEIQTKKRLIQKNVESYVPLFYSRDGITHPWMNVYKPLFTSIVFVYMCKAELATILNTRGITGFLYWHCMYAEVMQEDIMNIRMFSTAFGDIRLEKTIPCSSVERGLLNIHGENEKDVWIQLPSLGYKMIAAKKDLRVRVEHLAAEPVMEAGLVKEADVFSRHNILHESI